jgi:hypothetical protein
MSAVMSVNTPECKCLACGYQFDCATAPDDEVARPKDGDISICLKCGHLAAFNDDMTLRPLTDAEMLDVAGDKEILRMQAARSAAMKG